MNDAVKRLREFIEENHFSEGNWEERGLNISEPEVVKFMELTLRRFGMNILELLESSTQSGSLEEGFVERTNGLKIEELDTEEKEWIIDLVCEIGKILGIELQAVNSVLGVLMYGPDLGEFVSNKSEKDPNFVQSYKVENTCKICGYTLKCLVKEKKASKGEIGIAKCWACKKHSIFFIPEETVFLTSYNFYPVEIEKNNPENVTAFKTKIEDLNS